MVTELADAEFEPSIPARAETERVCREGAPSLFLLCLHLFCSILLPAENCGKYVQALISSGKNLQELCSILFYCFRIMNTSRNTLKPETEALMLTETEFAVLNTLRKNPAESQRALAQATNRSVGTVNSTLRRLRENGYANDLNITEAGLKALEPYRVNNAIVMAAGMSTRFAPISYEKPKGLLEVRGELLIERVIRQLQEAGIDDITVVVGYKMEQFLFLEDKMNVKIAVNKHYDERNNHSTLKIVEAQLDNTFICCSDNYYTENVFEPYVYQAYYAAVWHDGPTDEWGIHTTARGRISKTGPGCSDAWIMFGQAYFDREFSKRFVKILNEVYDRPETKSKLWEEIYADHIKELDMYIRKYPPGIIHEFDSLDELRYFEPDFICNIDSRILDNICTTLAVQRDDLSNFSPIIEGLSNLSFCFEAKGCKYVYRHPGVATQGILNRRAEADAEKIAYELGLDKTFIYLDPDTGWKLSHYVNVTEHFDYHNPRHVKQSLDLIRQLHVSGKTIDNRFDIFAETAKIKERLLGGGQAGAQKRLDFPDFAELDSRATRLYQHCQADGVKPVLCHNDFYDPNILIEGESMYLIDWEYSGMSDYACDVGVFICCSDYTFDEALEVMRLYFGRDLSETELRHCIAYVSLASYYWFVWALFKEACDEPVGEYLYLWYRFAKEYGERALQLYESGEN